jgi:anti-sigma factor (TIGR02949 family)
MTEGCELNCEEVRDLLSPYLDRELTSEEMTAIAEHLESCPDCMHKSTVFGQLSRIIKHWEGIKASEENRQRLMEQVRRADAERRRGKLLPVFILVLLAAALLTGGTAALVVWLAGGGGEEGSGSEERQVLAECVHKAGRVEVVTDGARVLVRGPRALRAGQAVSCQLGAAAQLRWPARGVARTDFLLHGPAEMVLNDENTLIIEEQGRLVFHVQTGALPPRVAAGRWTVVLSGGPAVGLVELAAGGGIRVAMLKGEVRLGEGGPRIRAGTELTMDAGGALGAPRTVSDPAEFELLAPPADSAD